MKSFKQKLMLFVSLICIILVGLMLVFARFFLEPTYLAMVKGDLARGINAIEAAMADAARGTSAPVPVHLRDTHYQGAESLGNGKGYRYPHDYPNHYVDQRYLPTDLPLGTNYYTPGQNKTEQAAAEYWRGIKKK